MPTMHEIYQHHANRYDELVCAEDYKNNLGDLLHSLLDWQGLTVIEAGIGTGRVTKLYIEQVASAYCYDGSAHMLAYAEQNLARYASKLNFQVADNLALPPLPDTIDLFIEGWSFGHVAAACSNLSDVPSTVTQLVHNASQNVKSGGTVIMIETLGTFTTTLNVPNDHLQQFYDLLVQEHGFTRHIIRTDYQFSSVDEAIRVMGFFFGERMAQAIQAEGVSLIPECTGVWVRQQP